MKFGVSVMALYFAALPLGAATVFTVDPTLETPTTAGTYVAGATLLITVTGTVNLNAPGGLIITNPDGSLSTAPSASCLACWSPGYQYFLPTNVYPTSAGGDGLNHFSGGGGNFDMFPASHSAWAAQGKQTTDTTDPGALRFGALAYTFTPNPSATDWNLLGFGGVFSTGSGGTLQLILVDTYYPNNTGGFTVNIEAIESPEPSTVLLGFSGVGLLGFARIIRRRRAQS